MTNILKISYLFVIIINLSGCISRELSKPIEHMLVYEYEKGFIPYSKGVVDQYGFQRQEIMPLSAGIGTLNVIHKESGQIIFNSEDGDVLMIKLGLKPEIFTKRIIGQVIVDTANNALIQLDMRTETGYYKIATYNIDDLSILKKDSINLDVNTRYQNDYKYRNGYSSYIFKDNIPIFFSLNYEFSYKGSGSSATISNVHNNYIQFSYFDFNTWKFYKTSQENLAISLGSTAYCFTSLADLILVDSDSAIVFSCKDYHDEVIRHGYFYIDKLVDNTSIILDTAEEIVDKFPFDLSIVDGEEKKREEGRAEKNENATASVVSDALNETETVNEAEVPDKEDIFIEGKEVDVYNMLLTQHGILVFAGFTNGDGLIYLAQDSLDNHKWIYRLPKKTLVKNGSLSENMEKLRIPAISDDNKGCLKTILVKSGELVDGSEFPINIHKTDSNELIPDAHFVLSDNSILFVDARKDLLVMFSR